MKKRKQKNIIWLGLSSLINDISSEIIVPIIPLFLSSLGAGGILIGLAGGLRDSIASLLEVFSGWCSDKIKKRKIFVWIGYLFSSISKLLLAFSKTLSSAIFFLSIERTGKGIRDAPRDAIIAESTKKRGKGFGIHRAFDTSGAILGSIIVLFLLWNFELSFTTIILIAAIISFASLLPLIFVKETFEKKKKKYKFKISRKLKYLLFIMGTFSLANFSYMFFILKASENLGSIIIPVFLYVLFNIFYAAFAIPFGKLSDKIGKKKVILSGYLLFSLTFLGFAFASSFPVFLFLFPLYGLCFALVTSNQTAFVADIVKENKATSLGMFHTITGIIALPASLIAGILFQLSPSYPFIFSSVVSALSVLLLIKLK